jgi:Lon-like protease
MTRQTWTAFVSALAFVLTAVGLVLLPVPYVSWVPGTTVDTLGKVQGRKVITVQRLDTYRTSGQLQMTTVSETRPDARLALPEALLSYWMPNRDTLPREVVQPPSKSPRQIEREQRVMMEDSQQYAIVAALRAGGVEVKERPMITSVTIGSAADGKLKPGDLVLSINDVGVSGVAQAESLIRSREPGSSLLFVVQRNSNRKVIKFARSESTDGDLSGVRLGTGYQYAPKVTIRVNEQIGGPSAGLIFALAVHDKITPGAMLGGRRVAGTGTIDAEGRVGSIGAIQQKIAAADSAGATVFLVPAGNCDQLSGVRTDLDLVRVDTLQGAVTALGNIDAGNSEAVPRCKR